MFPDGPQQKFVVNVVGLSAGIRESVQISMIQQAAFLATLGS
jgi:hypothetical protein